MSFRPTLMSKWISRPSEILYRTAFNNIPSRASRPIFAQAQAQAFRRTLTTTPSARLKRPTPSTLFPKQRLNRRYNSSSSNGSGSGNANGQAGRTEKASLSERLKKLSREYGWAALGVYLALSALDFPFCFAAVRLLGVERIGHYEHVVVQFVKDKFKAVWPTSDESDGQGKLVEAEERNKDEASIWTQLVFAYAIHKSFIFIRVPLTAAVLPKVVKTLRGWGWNIGKRKPKST
ncbi:hypothetical protein N7541_006189 [Penicillium brevicompactum]|uniref:DUF1279 domain-containing protein n=1 Tax=Penicillium brevicompactum TaxID=5074 RepID=A0A9W9R666_PENBR|nr:hypothetical protein N7541_006189 [Penicillium brevicompactum]